MRYGYIDTCPEIGFKVFIKDFQKMLDIKSRFTQEFWEEYRALKEANDFNNEIVHTVRTYFKDKAEYEKLSINYPIQSRGSAMFKMALLAYFNWIVDNNYFNIIKLLLPAHDECNVEAPEYLAELAASKLRECMVDAGNFICTIVPIDAEISRMSKCVLDCIIDNKVIARVGDDILFGHGLENITTGEIHDVEIPKDMKKCFTSEGDLPTFWVH